MQTRDGTNLVADVYRPDGGGSWPVLVRRTPYGKRLNDLAADFNEAHFFASHGYLVIVQDTRGRFGSEGEWYPLIYEGLDGYDTVEWAAELDGAAGPVGTIGLEQDLEITGPVTAELFVSTSAVDTDFVVWLSDVHPDGYCQNLVETIVRGRFHRSYTSPDQLEPGRVYRLEVDMWNVSHLMRVDHRLRVHVTSSDFPRWERNLNTGSRLGYGAELQVATQTLHHDSEHPSSILLPVTPGKTQEADATGAGSGFRLLAGRRPSG